MNFEGLNGAQIDPVNPGPMLTLLVFVAFFSPIPIIMLLGTNLSTTLVSAICLTLAAIFLGSLVGTWRIVKGISYYQISLAKAYDIVAAANGWRRSDPTDMRPIGGKKNRFGIVEGTIRGYGFRFYEQLLYSFKGTQHDSVRLCLQVPWHLPSCTFTPKGSEVKADGKQITLEGNFSNFITLTTQQDGDAVLEVVTPDVMQALIQAWPTLNGHTGIMSMAATSYKLMLADRTITCTIDLPEYSPYQETIEKCFRLTDALLAQLSQNQTLAGH